MIGQWRSDGYRLPPVLRYVLQIQIVSPVGGTSIASISLLTLEQTKTQLQHKTVSATTPRVANTVSQLLTIIKLRLYLITLCPGPQQQQKLTNTVDQCRIPLASGHHSR